MSFDHVLTFCQKWKIVAILRNCGARKILINEVFAYYWLCNSFDYNPKKINKIKWHLKILNNFESYCQYWKFCGLQSEGQYKYKCTWFQFKGQWGWVSFATFACNWTLAKKMNDLQSLENEWQTLQNSWKRIFCCNIQFLLKWINSGNKRGTFAWMNECLILIWNLIRTQMFLHSNHSVLQSP